MDDDMIDELPQKPMPRFSIRWLIGLVTVAAVFFTLCQVAVSGARWAQVTLLLVEMTVATFIAYAVFFLIGLAWDAFLTERPLGHKTMISQKKPLHPRNSSGTPWTIVCMVASVLSGSGAIVKGIPRLGRGDAKCVPAVSCHASE